MTSTIVNLDLEEISFCYACIVHKHIEKYIELKNNGICGENEIYVIDEKKLAESKVLQSQMINPCDMDQDGNSPEERDLRYIDNQLNDELGQSIERVMRHKLVTPLPQDNEDQPGEEEFKRRVKEEEKRLLEFSMGESLFKEEEERRMEAARLAEISEKSDDPSLEDPYTNRENSQQNRAICLQAMHGSQVMSHVSQSVLSITMDTKYAYAMEEDELQKKIRFKKCFDDYFNETLDGKLASLFNSSLFLIRLPNCGPSSLLLQAHCAYGQNGKRTRHH